MKCTHDTVYIVYAINSNEKDACPKVARVTLDREKAIKFKLHLVNSFSGMPWYTFILEELKIDD